MALETVFNAITGVVETVKEWADPTGLIKNIEQGVFGNLDYRFSYDVFPEDLGAEYMNHYMIMRFFTPSGQLQAQYGAGGGAGFGNNNYNVALFMPTEAGGGLFPVFEDTHEFAEISMSNVLLNQIGAAKVAKGAAATTGRAINPGVQILYKSTHLRTFDFSFLFAPRSERESESMKRIIQTVRKYSAPEDQDIFYRAPAECEIEFHYAGQINPHVIKMKRQVVTGITVQYAPQGVYSTFTNGHPVTCMFSMRTREMEIIDRADVEAGF